MITNCPVCGKQVDTIRARAVSVRGDGKVVAFCSLECKAQWSEASKPVKAIVEDERSAPVIEITHEPASGVVTSAPDRRDALSSGLSTNTSSASGTTTIPEGAGGGTKDASGKPSKTVGGSGSSDSAGKSGSASGKGDGSASTGSKDAKVGKSGTDDAKAAGAKGSDTGATSAADAKVAKGGKATDGGGKAAKSDGTSGSGAGKAGKSGAGVDSDYDAAGKSAKGGTSATDAGAKKAPPKAFDGKTTETPIAGFRIDEFQDYEKSDPSRAKPNGNTGLKVGLVLALLGGGALLAYKFVFAKRGTTPPAETRDAATGSSAIAPTPATPDAPAEPPKPDLSATYNTTLELLRAQLATGTDRVKLQAATALARIKDPAAITQLAALLADGRRSETDRIETAYSLAGAGDKRGRDLLIAKATGGNREDKHLSAVRLAQLGEKQGFETLANSMQYPQYRVQAAALLARNNDPAGIKQLDDIIASTQTSADDKTTATIYLAIARPALVPKLHELLPDNRWNKDAARVLARLKDAAAAPVLAQQLELSGLRLGSAHALRLLGGDHAAIVAKLVASLEGAKDTEQIAIAHAILLLVGPPELGEYEAE